MTASGTDNDLGSRVAQAVDHPVVHNYLTSPRNLTPRRLSDVGARRAWEETDACLLLDDVIGRYQISLITNITPPATGQGWVIGRDKVDFTDEDVDFAVGALPVLAALDRMHRWLDRRSRLDPEEARIRYGMTVRELDILELMASGLTADAMGHVRRISPRTVRKHVQNIYRKLACNDRLVAVSVAQAVGLLPPVVRGPLMRRPYVKDNY